MHSQDKNPFKQSTHHKQTKKKQKNTQAIAISFHHHLRAKFFRRSDIIWRPAGEPFCVQLLLLRLLLLRLRLVCVFFVSVAFRSAHSFRVWRIIHATPPLFVSTLIFHYTPFCVRVCECARARLRRGAFLKCCVITLIRKQQQQQQQQPETSDDSACDAIDRGHGSLFWGSLKVHTHTIDCRKSREPAPA